MASSAWPGERPSGWPGHAGATLPVERKVALHHECDLRCLKTLGHTGKTELAFSHGDVADKQLLVEGSEVDLTQFEVLVEAADVDPRPFKSVAGLHIAGFRLPQSAWVMGSFPSSLLVGSGRRIQPGRKGGCLHAERQSRVSEVWPAGGRATRSEGKQSGGGD